MFGSTHFFGSVFDRCTDADVGTAATDIAIHGIFYLCIAWIRVLFEEGGRIHDLAGLAVPALGYIVLDPGFLKRMIAFLREAFKS